MKEKLSAEDRKSVIVYRIERAKEMLAEVEVLKSNGFYRTAINRLYYACFSAVTALLLQDNIQASTHNGVKSMLGLHYVSTGKISVRLGKVYGQLYDSRQSFVMTNPSPNDTTFKFSLNSSALSFVVTFTFSATPGSKSM